MSVPRLGRVPPRSFPGKPGRPRKAPVVPLNPGHTSGHADSGQLASDGSAEQKAPRPSRTQATQAGALVTLAPRLVDLPGAVAYLGRSPWAVRALMESGRLTPVRVELAPGWVLRRLLFDVRALDALVDSWGGR